MELITSTRRTTELATTKQPAWALAIKADYGELPAFAAKFTPAVQKYCAQNMARAVEKNLPTFARIVGTYGEAGTAAIIGTHITDAILKMGEDRDVDPADVQFIAAAICESERFRLLRFTTVLGFFHLLKCGEFEIYGKVTPRKILEAFRKYAVEAQAKENRIAYELENAAYRIEREESRANSVSWEEYAASKGIHEKTFTDYLARQQRQHYALKTFAALIQTIISVLVFIANWEEDQRNRQKRTETAQISTQRQKAGKL